LLALALLSMAYPALIVAENAISNGCSSVTALAAVQDGSAGRAVENTEILIKSFIKSLNAPISSSDQQSEETQGGSFLRVCYHM
jgi:hypothetical protein